MGRWYEFSWGIFMSTIRTLSLRKETQKVLQRNQ
jgi:hypothetical protein